jgi:hypothetical protein
MKKTLIALAAVATLATAGAGAASAKTHIDLNIGFGLGGFGGGYPVYDPGFDDGGCFYKWKTVKVWNYWHTAYKIKHIKKLVCY